MSAYLGDIAPAQILYFLWESHGADGASITRATNGTISVYKDDGLTQSTIGVTDGEDFDGLTGIHSVKIDTSADGTFYAAGHDFAVVLSAATIDGKTVNSVLGHFSINNRAALRPSTAGRTLGVDVSGNVALQADQAVNVTKVNGTVQTARDLGAQLNDSVGNVRIDTANIQARIPGSLTGAGNMKSNVAEWREEVPDPLVNSLIPSDVENWVGHAPITPDVDGLPIVQPLHRYSAEVRVVRDEVGTTDRYEVVWLRDGEPFTGTVTTPKIQVVKQSDGSDLVASVALPASPTGLGYLYEATGAELQADGAGYLVYLDATIDGALRQDWVPVGVNTSAVDAAIKAQTDLLPSDPASESAVEGAIGALAIPTAADNADAVWDEMLADHLAVGSTGEQLQAAGASGDPWATALPGAYGPGTAGQRIGDDLDAAVSSRATPTDVADAITAAEPVDANLVSVAPDAIADAGVAPDLDTYAAKVDLVIDRVNNIDHYAVSWFKNSTERVRAGITSPTIQVWKVSDGSDLIAVTAMTEIGMHQTFRYEAVTTERVSDGQAYQAEVTAVIDGATRNWLADIGRDA